MVVTGCYRVCRSSYTPLGDVYHVGSAHVLHGHDDVIFTMMSMLYATSHTPVPGPAGWLLFGVNGVLGTRPAPVPRTDSERQCTVLSTVEVDAFQYGDELLLLVLRAATTSSIRPTAADEYEDCHDY
eukprot:3883802-Rhodomonas_salina.4